MKRWDIYTNKHNGSRYMQEQDDGRFYDVEDIQQITKEVLPFLINGRPEGLCECEPCLARLANWRALVSRLQSIAGAA